MMPTLSDFKRYYIYLRRNSTQFPCPDCGDPVLSKDYEDHCTRNHNLNAKFNCVWCGGRVSWKWGKKGKHVDHLLQCWRKFMAPLPQTVPETLSYFDSTRTSPMHDFFGCSPFSDLPRAYDPVFPVVPKPFPLTFTDENLNLAASCVRMFLEDSSLEFFHIMVRAIAFPKFLEAMEADRGTTRTLPFSCWCDGGKYEQAVHRQHRHMIVVSPKGHFVCNVWEKIKIPEKDRPCKSFPCIRRKRITENMHLVNALGYLSQRKSRCNFSFDDSARERSKHFYIFHDLPADFRLALSTLWDGGILQLLDQDFKHIDPLKLVQKPLEFHDLRWQIRIRDLPGIRSKVRLPVSERFVPTTRPTEFYLHLLHGKKLYYEPSTDVTAVPEHLLHDVVFEEWWTPGKHQQKCLNSMKPLFDRNAELESRLLEIPSLKRKLEALEQENSQLLKKMNRMNEEEIARLRSENARMQTVIDHLETELTELINTF